ncbi:MAG: Sec-independent protein translocase protein TatB [Hyphomicrobiales bacterium]
MFDVGGMEFLVVAIVAIIVVGPRDLPAMLRNFGRFVGKIRALARDFHNQFENTAHQSGLDEVRRELGDSATSSRRPIHKAAANPADTADESGRDGTPGTMKKARAETSEKGGGATEETAAESASGKVKKATAAKATATSGQKTTGGKTAIEPADGKELHNNKTAKSTAKSKSDASGKQGVESKATALASGVSDPSRS